MENFTPLALSRAHFYCKGSPVQFSHVELLRRESTGQFLVTLTFKNFYNRILSNFTAHFVCKNRAGVVLLEDDFRYENLHVGEGQSFGTNDAVFLSDEPIGRVDVTLVSVQYEGMQARVLTSYEAINLPKQRPLPQELTARVAQRTGYTKAKFVPTNVADGWQCSCGAFNYNAGHSAKKCIECGVTKDALTTMLKG